MYKKIIFMFFWIIPLVYSQSLDSLLAEAFRNNPQLKSYRERIKMSDLKADQVSFLPPPSVGLEISQMPFNTLNYFKEPLSQTISFSQMFMTGGKLEAMYNAEKKESEIIKLEADDLELSIARDIRKIYSNIATMEHHIIILDKTIKTAEYLLSFATANIQINKSNAVDAVKIKVRIADYKSEVESMKNELKSEYIMMNNLLGRELDTTNIVIEESHAIELDDYELAEESPVLLKMDEMINMSRLESEANERSLSPDIMAEVMLMRMPRGMILTTANPMPEMGENGVEYMYSLKASITLPFLPWSAGRVKLKNEEIEAGIKGIGYQKENMKRELQSEIATLRNKAQSILIKIKSLKDEVVPLYSQIVELRISRLQTNDDMAVMVLDDLIMLTMKEEELADLEGEFRNIIADIEYLTGDKHLLH